jgi:hypothetical protein
MTVQPTPVPVASYSTIRQTAKRWVDGLWKAWENPKGGLSEAGKTPLQRLWRAPESRCYELLLRIRGG